MPCSFKSSALVLATVLVANPPATCLGAGGLNSEPIMIDTVAQLDSFMQTGTANVSAKLSFEESEVYNGSLFSVNVKGKVGNGKNIIQFFFGAPGLFARYYLYDKWSRWIKIYSAE